MQLGKPTWNPENIVLSNPRIVLVFFVPNFKTFKYNVFAKCFLKQWTNKNPYQSGKTHSNWNKLKNQTKIAQKLDVVTNCNTFETFCNTSSLLKHIFHLEQHIFLCCTAFFFLYNAFNILSCIRDSVQHNPLINHFCYWNPNIWLYCTAFTSLCNTIDLLNHICDLEQHIC